MVWKGTTSTDWNTAANWWDNSSNPPGVPTWAPGTAGHTTDTATFDGTATANCELNSSVTLKSLTLDGTTGNDFRKILTIYRGNSAVIQNGTFEFDSGTLNLDTTHGGSTHIDLDNSTGNWKNGDFSSTVGGGGVYVFNGSTLNILQNGWALGASLVIGENIIGSDSAGTLNISSTTVGMTQNLKLYQSANITIGAKGTMNFLQDVNSATKGGIVVNIGGTSAITSAGTINRTTVDTTGQTLQVLVPTTQTGSTSAQFNLGAGCAIAFQNAAGKGLHIMSGHLKDGAGSTLGGDIKVDAGASEELGPPNQAGTVNYSINGNLTLSGTLIFDYTAGSLGDLTISGNFTVSVGTLDINVDGSRNGACDQINVGGTWTLNSGYVNVNTVNASPPDGQGWAYVFVTATTTVGSGWGSDPSNGGYRANYSFDSNNPGKLDVGTQPPPPP